MKRILIPQTINIKEIINRTGFPGNAGKPGKNKRFQKICKRGQFLFDQIIFSCNYSENKIGK
jgi:hypothetical protein